MRREGSVWHAQHDIIKGGNEERPEMVGRGMKRSDALDLERGVFTKGSARQIASSLKRSAMRSTRRKGTPYLSAMSMLNFHINRAGKGLTAPQKERLERAKGELRTQRNEKARPLPRKPVNSSRKKYIM